MTYKKLNIPGRAQPVLIRSEEALNYLTSFIIDSYLDGWIPRLGSYGSYEDYLKIKFRKENEAAEDFYRLIKERITVRNKKQV